MPTLSANANITLSLTDYDSVTITCRGPVLVEAVSGLGVTGKIAEFAGTKTFGPFSPAGSLKLTAYGNDAQYEVADGVAPSVGGTTAVATAATLGLVKPGANLTVQADGTLDASGGSSETYSHIAFSSVTTSGTPTGGATVAPASAACMGLYIQNQATPIEYQRNSSGAFHVIRPYERKFIFGITDASQIGFRRTDYATARTTQITAVQLQLINTTATYSVTNLNVTTTSNTTYVAFASFACVALEVKNTSNIDVNLKINATGSTVLLRRNETYLVTGITNANQVSAVSYSNTSAVTLCAETFQSVPGLSRGGYILADALSANTRIYLGEPQYTRDVFAMPSFFMPFTKYNPKGKTISLFRTVAESYITGGTSANTVLATGETYATYAPVAQYGTYTALTNTFGTSSTNTYASALNTTQAIDVSNSAIHATIQRVGTGGSVSAVFIDLFSTGSPSAPGADYHTLNVATDLNNGFASVNGYSSRSFGINLFSVVGAGANLSAITFARFRVTGTIGLIVRPSEIRSVKNASTKASICFTFDDGHATAVTKALPALSGYGYPGILYPSPNASGTGNNNGSAGSVQVDNMLALQHKFGWQIASQDFLREQTLDMTPDEWLESQNKNFVFGAAIGFDGDGLRDASQYGGGPYYQTSEQVRIAQRIQASIRRFDGGAGSLGDGVTPFTFCDTNPPGDPWNMRALNVNSWGSTASTSNNIYLKLKSYVDQAVACKGIAILAQHNDWEQTEIGLAMAQIIAYIQTLEAAGTAEVLTLAQIRKRQAAGA